MKIGKLILAACVILVKIAAGQPLMYTTANGHSHNDYAQQVPFFAAYQEQFGSIEADIFLYQGKLLVGHDSVELTPARTLEKMYLQPMADFIKQNKGNAYNEPGRKLQLLIDIKTDSIHTLDALVKLLKKYPAIINNKSVSIVITGNRPSEKLYGNYPAFIWFDGRLNQRYDAKTLAKIALLSDDFSDYSGRKQVANLTAAERNRVVAVIEAAHKKNKPVRFWATPDNPAAWADLIKLKVDFLNTDHTAALSDFLRRRYDSLRLLPYNRIIHSAGEVIRFGKPSLENHALDAAVLSEDGKVVIEDRYGLLAIDAVTKKIISRWSFTDIPEYKNYLGTYSGIKTFTENGRTWIAWSAAERDAANAAVIIAEWADGSFTNFSHVPIAAIAPASNALPNEVAISKEKEGLFLYVALNGNNELLKIRWSDKAIVWRAATGVAPYGVTIAGNKIYVTNWAGPTATDSTKERAGVPWGLAYTDPGTGATSSGTVSVFDPSTGKLLKEIKVGLHPNAIKASSNNNYVFVANGSSDVISVINTKTNTVVETIPVGLLKGKYSLQGSTPNGLELSADNGTLYVSNGFDNAVAVVQLGQKAGGKGASVVTGFIPTEAYPAGLKIIGKQLVVANLESDGANVKDEKKQASSIHNELGSVSIIPLPTSKQLKEYTLEVAQLNLINRMDQMQLLPRANTAPVPVPERLGEPSVFKHVVYIIKENKTYDQVFGDVATANGDSSLCVFGEKITPNIHALARQFGWMDDYYASGKSSAEGHQWTDAGMVSDYVEKNVRAWFRSYPHRQEDALVYNKAGFIWNHALDHGKTVRVFGEACETAYDKKLQWADLYANYKAGKKPDWYNKSTIARIRPIISTTFPDCDNITFSDQQRADIFIEEWKQLEQENKLPNLMVVSLPNDHSAGTSPGFPTPNAMVADNDLAVGRIIEMITKSKSWDSTVIFITQDDSQGGWDHVSAYRSVGLTVSPYSTGRLNSSNYNQVSMLRTIEQILGLPPMNVMDATARLMTDCFQNTKLQSAAYTALPSNIPLDQMNKPLAALYGQEKKYALQSQNEVFNEVDGGEDDTMNRIIWFYAKGNVKYPTVVK